MYKYKGLFHFLLTSTLSSQNALIISTLQFHLHKVFFQLRQQQQICNGKLQINGKNDNQCLSMEV